MKNFIIYWLPPFVLMGFIFPLTNNSLTFNSTSHIIVPIIKWFLPHASQATIDTLHIVMRKFGHFGGYALLTFLLFRGFRGRNKGWHWKWIIYAGLIAIGYGSLDEFLQTLMSSRTGSIYDWMTDSGGVVFAMGTISIKNKKVKRNLT